VVEEYLKHNCDLTTIAMNEMIGSGRVCDDAYEVTLTGNGLDIELDLACVWDGRVYVGEQKRNADLKKKRVSRTSRISDFVLSAQALNATRFQFDTAQNAWPEPWVLASQRAFDQAGIGVVFNTRLH
jgi:hypothetical protein